MSTYDDFDSASYEGIYCDVECDQESCYLTDRDTRLVLCKGHGLAVHYRVYRCALAVEDADADPSEMEWKVEVGETLVITAVRRCYGITLHDFRWEIHKLSPEGIRARKRRRRREERREMEEEIIRICSGLPPE